MKVYIQIDDVVEVYIKAARGLKKHVFTCNSGGHYDITDEVMKIKVNGKLVFERKHGT